MYEKVLRSNSKPMDQGRPDLHDLNKWEIFAVVTNLCTLPPTFSSLQTETLILMVRRAICFESTNSHVANYVPEGNAMLEVQTD